VPVPGDLTGPDSLLVDGRPRVDEFRRGLWPCSRVGARESVGVFFFGLAAGLVGSVLFNLGIALQGLEARETPRSSALRPSLLGRLIRRPRWVLGLALGFVGIVPQVLAFATAPFVVVQTALAAGL
jgi:hypothetical protein